MACLLLGVLSLGLLDVWRFEIVCVLPFLVLDLDSYRVAATFLLIQNSLRVQKLRFNLLSSGFICNMLYENGKNFPFMENLISFVQMIQLQVANVACGIPICKLGKLSFQYYQKEICVWILWKKKKKISRRQLGDGS